MTAWPAADWALLAQAQALRQALRQAQEGPQDVALLDSGHHEAARAVLRGVRVLTWSVERMIEGIREERKAA